EAVDPRVATRCAVVAEQKEFVRRNPSTAEALRVAPVGFHVALDEPPTVDKGVTGALRPPLAVQPDDTLDEDAAGAALDTRELRRGGQYVAKTSPIRFFRGTRPQTRESHDEARLSPIIRYSSFGIRASVPLGGMSAIVSVCVSRRSAWM